MPLGSSDRCELFDILVDMRDSIDGAYPSGLKYAMTGVTPVFSKKKGKGTKRKGGDYVPEAEHVGQAFNADDDERVSGMEGETEVESLDISRPGPSSGKHRKMAHGKGGKK